MLQTFPPEYAREVGYPVAVNTAGGDEVGVDLIPDLAREEEKRAWSGGVLEGEGLGGGCKLRELNILDGVCRGCRGDIGGEVVEEERASRGGHFVGHDGGYMLSVRKGESKSE